MKLTFRILLLLLLPFMISGCCGDCNEVNDNLLSIQVFDKTTKANISKTLDSNKFFIIQKAPESPVILPVLEFKDNEIRAEFFGICLSREIGGSMEVSILGSIKEAFTITLQTTTKSCCHCSKIKIRIKELTPQMGSKVTLALNSNVLKIEI